MKGWPQHLATSLQNMLEMRTALIAALALRLIVMIAAFTLTGTSVMTQGDTASYLNPGRSLILHGTFSSAGLPEIDRTPGYPLFAELTGMLWDNALLTVSAQILISLASLLLVCRIANGIFPNPNAGVVAAWLYAVEPLSIVYAMRLMPETLFVFLLLLTIDRILSFQNNSKLAELVFAGFSLAAATYVRPVSYYLAVALALGIAYTAPKQRGLWWKAPAVLLAVVIPAIAAWQIRNAVESDYSGFSSIVEKNLYFFQSAEVTAETQHISLEAEQQQLGYPEDKHYAAAHPEQSGWTQAQRLRFMRNQSIQILEAHPFLYLRTHFAGVALVAFTPCATELLQLLGSYPADGVMPHRILNEGVVASAKRVILAHPTVAAVMTMLEAFLLLLYAFAIRGYLSAGINRPAMRALIGIAVYFLLISGGAQAVGRYRLPVMPELCILAAGGLTPSRKEKLRSHDSSAADVAN